MMNLKQALELIGGLSTPSKMPCYSYSTSAKECQTGGKLHDIKGSVCEHCYARRGNYRFSNVANAHARRLASLTHPQWVEAMTLAIGQLEYTGHFRWHDSGDLQSVAHLANIVQVARNLPHIKFWLPTREYGYVGAWSAVNGNFPDNLIIRLSAYMVDGDAPTSLAQKFGVATSTVCKVNQSTCPAPTQGNKCMTCRACWDKGTANVAYSYH